MKRSYIGGEIFTTCSQSCFELKYYILEEKIKMEHQSYIEYGIEIEKKDGNKVEKSQVKEITTNQTRITNIVKTLMKNGVTPIHLHDVIEDML